MSEKTNPLANKNISALIMILVGVALFISVVNHLITREITGPASVEEPVPAQEAPAAVQQAAVEPEATTAPVKKNGVIKEFYPNGILKAERSYINDVLDGESRTYYENGKLESSAMYSNGVIDGPIAQFTQDGVKLTEAAY
jgi:hypothetical protein